VSQENVELYRRAIDDMNTTEGVPETLLTPDFCIENIITAVTDKTYYGASGCREWVKDLSDAFAPGPRLEVEKIIVDRDDYVVGRNAFVGTGARSGAPLRLRWISVLWFDRGKATRAAGYATRSEALKALGLEE
jgi:hypothetical protein